MGRIVAALLLAAVTTAILTFGSPYATRVSLDEAATRGENTLRLAISVLRGHMRRYEALPLLIADHDDIKRLLVAPSPGRRAEINQYLKRINTELESSDIYVMMPDGETIAASNYDGPASFVGENFSYRPYFQDAIAGGQGRFFALGTTSLKRGYYFASPVRVAGNVLGVVVVKIDIDAIEASWAGADYEFVVSDPEGIIFMSGRKDWLYGGLLPLTPDRRARTEASRRYANAELRELPVEYSSLEGVHKLMSVGIDAAEREYLVLEERMPEADWTVKVLLDTGPLYATARTRVMGAFLLLALAALATAIVLQRRARLAERMELQRSAREELEHRVEERTADLAEVNRRLELEVAERTATEIQLRQTQADLIQAGKLAALGQMAAALSHEFNQPLTAVRTYAENAATLIDRARVPDARANILRISSLTERMASIARHLRNFARKPNERLGPVSVAEVVRDTLEIVDWRVKAAGADLRIDLGDPPPVVNAGVVRLQQVLVNLMSNAADAVEGLADRTIDLTARCASGKVTISIRDRGPGISAAVAERIFDPFFTTKGVGKGLGLGLSITYNIVKDFGGTLTTENHPEGGAIFTVTLDEAVMPAAGAASAVEAAE
jgi:two-component system, NtrC family, C4-dicarboxylate transport sensor histidine kinase DctB